MSSPGSRSRSERERSPPIETLHWTETPEENSQRGRLQTTASAGSTDRPLEGMEGSGMRANRDRAEESETPSGSGEGQMASAGSTTGPTTPSGSAPASAGTLSGPLTTTGSSEGMEPSAGSMGAAEEQRDEETDPPQPSYKQYGKIMENLEKSPAI